MADRESDRQRELLAARLRDLQPYPASRFEGKGLVVCAGGAQLFTNAFVLLRVLRKTLGFSLPIEVWHLGAEMSGHMARILEREGATVIDARAVLAEFPSPIVDGWQLKIYAILHSAFREVLLLDADQVPARDPAEVFDWPEYRAEGAVFWPDVFDISETNPLWRACGLQPTRRPALESGQVLVDKARHWGALQAVLHLNEQAGYFYDFVYGDKDTFLAGWLAAGHRYALVPHLPIADLRCFFQRDFAGEVLFQHRTNAKWRYRGEQYAITGFRHEAACQAAIGALRQVWNGRVFDPPLRSLAARKLEALVEQTGSFRLATDGAAPVPLTLRAGNELKGHPLPSSANWYVADGEHGPQLHIVEGGRMLYRLDPVAGAGIWRGMSLEPPQTAAELTAEIADPATLPGDWAKGLVADLVRGALTPQGLTEAGASALSAALALLVRTEPAVAAALEQCASDADHGDALRAIAARLRETMAAQPDQPLPSREYRFFDERLYRRRR